MKVITCIAPVNIAVIKYWGKRDEELILPINDSISATLSTENICAKTTVMISPTFKEDRLWLNGREESCENPRLQNCLREVRRRILSDGNEKDVITWKAHICSENNFPTAAGLASSAAGYACLVFALSKIYGIRGDISGIARQGSGSACRSILGGFVQWNKGVKDDGSDSLATQIVPASHWSELRILILVVDEKHKAKSSKTGMKISSETSELLNYRASHCVPERVKAIRQAIMERDFNMFAEITMKDSNQFHAVCLDSYPPIFYMNQVSQIIVDFIHSYNKLKGHNAVAYTFDAGPNACLFLKESDVPEVLAWLNKIFPPSGEKSEYIRGIPVDEAKLEQDINTIEVIPQHKGMLKYIIYTRLGNGPEELQDVEDHLLCESGLPKKLLQ